MCGWVCVPPLNSPSAMLRAWGWGPPLLHEESGLSLLVPLILCAQLCEQSTRTPTALHTLLLGTWTPMAASSPDRTVVPTSQTAPSRARLSLVPHWAAWARAQSPHSTVICL